MEANITFVCSDKQGERSMSVPLNCITVLDLMIAECTKVEGKLLDKPKEEWFKIKDGKKYVRVTAMLSAVSPSEYVVSEDELVQYGAMGTIIHGMAEMVLKRNDNPTDLYIDFPDEWKIVQEGSLGLQPGNANPKGFMDAHLDINFSVDIDSIEVEMYNDELRLCGTSDLFTTYKGEPCTFDWKTSRSYGADKKLKYFKQLALYSIMKEAMGYPKDKYLIIGPLNPNNKCGYGKALVTDEVDKYRELALGDLKKFKEMYKY